MSKVLAVLAVTALVLLAGGGAVYAYDASRSDLIAPGVRAGDVDLGGLRASEARVTLERELATRLERPLRVSVGHERFTLSARRAGVRTDVEGTVQAALARSRSGDVVSRTVRSVSGDRVEADVPVHVSYSRRKVNRFVRTVERRLEREPRSAQLSYTGTGVRQVASRPGTAVRSTELRRRVVAELVDPDGDRRVRGRVRTVAPNVTTAELSERYPTVLIVNRDAKELRLYRRLELERTYRIAVGQVGLETPAGLYRIQNKAIDPDWSVPNSDWAGDLAGRVVPGGTPENPLKARWMGIYDGAGIHGTSDTGSLGTSASHGCIRMSVPEVKELFDKTPVGAPVYIA